MIFLQGGPKFEVTPLDHTGDVRPCYAIGMGQNDKNSELQATLKDLHLVALFQLLLLLLLLVMMMMTVLGDNSQLLYIMTTPLRAQPHQSSSH